MTDHGFVGNIVNRTQEQARLAQETADRLKEQAAREQARLEESRGPSYAENQARIQRERAEAAKRDAEMKERALKAALKKRYLSVPGTTPEGFEEEYPRLLKEHAAKVAAGEDAEIPATANEYASPELWGL